MKIVILHDFQNMDGVKVSEKQHEGEDSSRIAEFDEINDSLIFSVKSDDPDVARVGYYCQREGTETYSMMPQKRAVELYILSKTHKKLKSVSNLEEDGVKKPLVKSASFNSTEFSYWAASTSELAIFIENNPDKLSTPSPQKTNQPRMRNKSAHVAGSMYNHGNNNEEAPLLDNPKTKWCCGCTVS